MYQIKSIKTETESCPTLTDAIARARALFDEYQPAFGVQVEDATTGETVWDSEDGYAAESDAAAESVELQIGDRVEGGKGDDHDTGRVVEVDGDQVTVAWDSGVRTTQHASLLRAEHA